MCKGFSNKGKVSQRNAKHLREKHYHIFFPMSDVFGVVRSRIVLPRLVLLTFATDSDASIIVKYEIYFVLFISSWQSSVVWIYYLFPGISFWLRAKLSFITLYLNKYSCTRALAFYISLSCLLVCVSYFMSFFHFIFILS